MIYTFTILSSGVYVGVEQIEADSYEDAYKIMDDVMEFYPPSYSYMIGPPSHGSSATGCAGSLSECEHNKKL